jgi:hypothetical protein
MRRDWSLHINILAWLIISHAALVACLGMIIMVAGRFAIRLMQENPGLFPPDMPPDAIHVVGPASFLIGVIFQLIAVPSIMAGVGLLYHRNWGRGLTLVMSFVRLLEFPLGTITAIYSFWVLLSQGGRDFYRSRLTTT